MEISSEMSRCWFTAFDILSAGSLQRRMCMLCLSAVMPVGVDIYDRNLFLLGVSDPLADFSGVFFIGPNV